MDPKHSVIMVLFQVDSKDSDQSVWMRRLTFAGCTGDFVCFTVLRLVYTYVVVGGGH